MKAGSFVRTQVIRFALGRNKRISYLCLRIIQKVVEKGCQGALCSLAERGAATAAATTAAAAECIEGIVHAMSQRPTHAPRLVTRHVHHCTQYIRLLNIDNTC